MSAAVVSGVVALVLEQDPNLTPDTVKARLMLSASKLDLADPFATRAGMLNINAALAEAGYASQAPSPRAFRDEASGMMGFEETFVLWKGSEWSLTYLWSDGYLWCDGYLWSDDALTSDATSSLIDD
jgi:serine protease AprX